MQGAAQTAKAPPRSAFEPRRRACCRRPGAIVRSGHGRSPMNARPITISTKPAILTCVCLSTVPPIAAAPAPSSTNTVVKPRMNGMLAMTIRRLNPRSPSRSTSTAEIADRYPGSSGSTQGVITETRPARNAIGSFSVIEALERLVDAPLVLRPERGRRLRPGLRPRPRPRARLERESRGCRRRAAEREHPREQVEAARPWRREDRRPELVHHRVQDLPLRLTRRNALLHLGLHLLRDLGIGLVEGRVARRADEQRLEAPLARVCAGRSGGRERERHRGHCEELHELSASRMPFSRSFVEAGPVMCGGTTRPCLSMKNVSGTPLTPQRPNVVPTPSRMFG